MRSVQDSVVYLTVAMVTNFSSFAAEYYSSEFSSVYIGYPYSNELSSDRVGYRGSKISTLTHTNLFCGVVAMKLAL
jgi:hypothetical protein